MPAIGDSVLGGLAGWEVTPRPGDGKAVARGGDKGSATGVGHDWVHVSDRPPAPSPTASTTPSIQLNVAQDDNCMGSEADQSETCTDRLFGHEWLDTRHLDALCAGDEAAQPRPGNSDIHQRDSASKRARRGCGSLAAAACVLLLPALLALLAAAREMLAADDGPSPATEDSVPAFMVPLPKTTFPAPRSGEAAAASLARPPAAAVAPLAARAGGRAVHVPVAPAAAAESPAVGGGARTLDRAELPPHTDDGGSAPSKLVRAVRRGVSTFFVATGVAVLPGVGLPGIRLLEVAGAGGLGTVLSWLNWDEDDLIAAAIREEGFLEGSRRAAAKWFRSWWNAPHAKDGAGALGSIYDWLGLNGTPRPLPWGLS